MANGDDWANEEKKITAVYRVLRYLANHPAEAAACVGNDNAAHELFEREGGLAVPIDKGARVVIFASGEKALKLGSSVILEVPRPGLENAPDEELKQFVLGNYPYWPPL